MSNNFTTDMAIKSENLNSIAILRFYKQNMMLRVLELKSKEPRLTQKQICNQLGYSDSPIKRYRDDIQMDSSFSRNIYRKKCNKSNNSKTQTQPNTKNEKIKSNKNNKKNDLKCGSILESNPDENTKYITVARKMVDNV